MTHAHMHIKYTKDCHVVFQYINKNGGQLEYLK